MRAEIGGGNSILKCLAQHPKPNIGNAHCFLAKLKRPRHKSYFKKSTKRMKVKNVHGILVHDIFICFFIIFHCESPVRFSMHSGACIPNGTRPIDIQPISLSRPGRRERIPNCPSPRIQRICLARHGNNSFAAVIKKEKKFCMPDSIRARYYFLSRKMSCFFCVLRVHYCDMCVYDISRAEVRNC